MIYDDIKQQFSDVIRFSQELPEVEIDELNHTIDELVKAVFAMGKVKTGALIVLAQRSDLGDIIEGGIAIDAKVSVALLENIFFKNDLSPPIDACASFGGCLPMHEYHQGHEIPQVTDE